MKEPSAVPEGSEVRIRSTDRVGTLMAYMDPGNPYGNAPHMATGLRAYVRPIGGGAEWECKPEEIERISD